MTFKHFDLTRGRNLSKITTEAEGVAITPHVLVGDKPKALIGPAEGGTGKCLF